MIVYKPWNFRLSDIEECAVAGHSKFKNIMHRKGRQDALRSKMFSRLSKEITVAVKMGGGVTDPVPVDFANLRLADVLRRIPGGGVTDPVPVSPRDKTSPPNPYRKP